MYARVVSFVVKPFRIKQFCDSVDEIAKDIAAKQPGFIQHMILTSEQEKRLVMVISLWQTKTEADRYHKEVFSSVLSKLVPMIESEPVLRYYTASASATAATPTGITI